MTKLSVNLNKIAFLRNSRSNGIPSVIQAARTCIEAGAHGLTVHPRPDERHIRLADVYELAALLAEHPTIEFNIEGNPFPKFMELVRQVKPTQCTLVPDSPEAFTSDDGWELGEHIERLKPIIEELKDTGIRVSLFMNPNSVEFQRAKEIGADRIELYTEPYAAAYGGSESERVFQQYWMAAETARTVWPRSERRTQPEFTQSGKVLLYPRYFRGFHRPCARLGRAGNGIIQRCPIILANTR